MDSLSIFELTLIVILVQLKDIICPAIQTGFRTSMTAAGSEAGLQPGRTGVQITEDYSPHSKARHTCVDHRSASCCIVSHTWRRARLDGVSRHLQQEVTYAVMSYFTLLKYYLLFEYFHMEPPEIKVECLQILSFKYLKTYQLWWHCGPPWSWRHSGTWWWRSKCTAHRSPHDTDFDTNGWCLKKQDNNLQTCFKNNATGLLIMHFLFVVKSQHNGPAGRQRSDFKNKP